MFLRLTQFKSSHLHHNLFTKLLNRTKNPQISPYYYRKPRLSLLWTPLKSSTRRHSSSWGHVAKLEGSDMQYCRQSSSFSPDLQWQSTPLYASWVTFLFIISSVITLTVYGYISAAASKRRITSCMAICIRLLLLRSNDATEIEFCRVKTIGSASFNRSTIGVEMCNKLGIVEFIGYINHGIVKGWFFPDWDWSLLCR